MTFMDYLDLRAQSDGSYVEAIRDGEIIRVPENVAIMEDLFILRKISGNSSISSNAAPLQVAPKAPRDNATKNNSIMYDWKHGKFGGKKNNVLADLVPNFNWEISKNRKSANITRAKLAQMISATEEDVKLIELGELPRDDFILISRIEQVFGINLRKHPASVAQVNLADLQKRSEEKKKEKSPSNLFKGSNAFSGNDIEVIDN